MDYRSAEFDVDSSSRFLFTAQADKQADRQTNRQTDKQTDRSNLTLYPHRRIYSRRRIIKEKVACMQNRETAVLDHINDVRLLVQDFLDSFSLSMQFQLATVTTL